MLRKGMGVGRTGITHTQQLLAPYRSAPEGFCDQEWCLGWAKQLHFGWCLQLEGGIGLTSSMCPRMSVLWSGVEAGKGTGAVLLGRGCETFRHWGLLAATTLLLSSGKHCGASGGGCFQILLWTACFRISALLWYLSNKMLTQNSRLLGFVLACNLDFKKKKKYEMN